VTPKLLLADDSVTIQRVIELTFADEDVQVLAVGDGRQAIERVQSERPDIVLADVGMPERDGYEVAAFIKGDPQLAHIPVLLLTGAFEPVDEVRARAVGCDGVLVKPFEPQMVISRVRDLLAGIRGADALGRAPVSPPAEEQRAAPAVPAPGGSLEDYFDRLDAALANKVATAPAPELVRAAAPPVRLAAVPPPAPKPAPPAPAASSPMSDALDLNQLDLSSPGPEPPAPALAVAPAPVPMPVPAPAPTPAPAVAPEPRELSLQEAFAALLAAEQGASSTPVRGDVLPNDIVDEIANRVIARLGDETMRAAVLDVAERLVREEIARIKGQS
jgi:CheY-like chemotaxis protein